ncbi:MAG: RT0821/Lpp0805 family surface protein [Pseudomonadota bacterium]|nr:RT0821/Lpp0805 family surface protein [Pseudomonadota bacterium]
MLNCRRCHAAGMAVPEAFETLVPLMPSQLLMSVSQHSHRDAEADPGRQETGFPGRISCFTAPPSFLMTVLVITWCLVARDAGAQMVGWDIAMPGLDQTDMEMIQQVARVEMDGKSAGTVLDWSNPQTGASGTVTLVRRGTLRGQECRDLRHHFVVPNQAPWDLESRICRQDDGSWKVVDQRRRAPDPQTSSTEKENSR